MLPLLALHVCPVSQQTELPVHVPLLPVKLAHFFIGPEKVSFSHLRLALIMLMLRFQRPAFFAVRIFLAIISSLCEITFYRAVVEHINYRVGRYLFFMLLCSAGMWNASTGTPRLLFRLPLQC